MAEALGLISSIMGVIGICTKVAIQIRDIRDSIKGAPATLQAICVDCTTTAVVLQRLEQILRSQPHLLAGTRTTSRVTGGPIGLEDSFDALVTGIRGSIEQLNAEVETILRTVKDGALRVSQKAKFVWKEDFFKDCRQEIREQRSSLSFLLDCLQMESLVNIQVRLNERGSQNGPALVPSARTDAKLNTPISARLNKSALEGKQTGLYINLPRELDRPGTLALARRIRPQQGVPYRGYDAALIETLHTAIDKKDANGVSDALSQRLKPNALLSGSNLRPIHRALSIYWVPESRPAFPDVDKILYMLVLAGANLEEPSSDGFTPLIRAVKADASLYVIRLMCEMGADVNALSPNGGVTALHCAAVKERSEEFILILVASGADLDLKSSENEYTALMYAIDKNNIAAARKLLDYGCDPNAGNSKGLTPLTKALWPGLNTNLDMIQLLCERGASYSLARHIGDGMSLQPLAVAIQKLCSVEVAKILIKAGADVNGGGLPDELTPLVSASVHGNLEMAKLLIKSGADINLKSGGVRSLAPLHMAISNGFLDMAKYLVEAGANPEIKCGEGDLQAIYYAVAKKQSDILSMLIEKGALLDPMTKDEGRTPLAVAAILGAVEEIALLISAGAYIDCKDSSGCTPLVLALVNRQHDAAALLITSGADLCVSAGRAGSQSLHFAAAFGMDSAIKLMLDRGVPVDSRTKYNATALMDAVDSGYMSTVRLLLSNGANIHVVDEFGGTTLNYAVKHPVMLQFVLGLGLDVNRRDQFGTTALHGAVSEGDAVGVKILLQQGAKQFHGDLYRKLEDFLEKKNALTGTPAQIARMLEKEDVAKLLEEWNYDG